jgi:hypothetical protein
VDIIEKVKNYADLSFGDFNIVILWQGKNMELLREVPDSTF